MASAKTAAAHAASAKVTDGRTGPFRGAKTGRRALVATAVVFGVLVSAPSGAQATTLASCASGWNDAGANTCELIEGYTGAVASVVVPAGVVSMAVVADGAEGGPSFDDGYTPSPGGKGGQVTGTVPVTPGDTLAVVAGQSGLDQSTGASVLGQTFGGGGAGASGGAGGGGSFVFDGTGAVLAAAGGGGGGGYDYNAFADHGGALYPVQNAPGGAGSGVGTAGDGSSVAFRFDPTYGNPTHYAPGGGGGATTTSGGAGGHSLIPSSYLFGQTDGQAGTGPATLYLATHPNTQSPLLGGDAGGGSCYRASAAGGGGGYFGGGGGGDIPCDLEGGGGGGGSGHLAPGATSTSSQTGTWSGDGQVVLRYSLDQPSSPPPPPPGSGGVTCAKVTGTTGSTVLFTKCTPSSKASAKASGPSSVLTSGGTLTWSKSGQTTVVSASAAAQGQGGCKRGWVEWDVTGTVTGGTSAVTASGDAVSARLCESATGKIALVMGTAASL
jgi:hypothetical protein